jgi:DNA-directed RNA polymerase II subunit RPB9
MNEDERNTSMQFCQECNNLMYPREVLDRDNPQDSRLVYTCKSPNCIEKGRPRRECKDAESTLVWKHVVQHSMKVDDLINADIVNDPTLPRTQQVHCPEVRLRSPQYDRTPARTGMLQALQALCTKALPQNTDVLYTTNLT